MLMIASGQEGGTGQQVGRAGQLDERGLRLPPTGLLGPAGLRRRPAVGTPQGVGRGHQLDERVAGGADVLADDAAVCPLAAGVVATATASAGFPAHRVVLPFTRAPPGVSLAGRP